MTSDELLAYPSSGLNFDPELSHGPRDKHWVTGIESLDFTAQVITMGQFPSVLLALTSPFVGRAPASLVEQLRLIMPLHPIELSDAVTQFDTCMFWTKVTDQANEHIWLREMIRSSLDWIISTQRA